MAQLSKKHMLVNVFGGLGYISLIFQWLWAGVIFLPSLFENETIQNLFLPQEPSAKPVPQDVPSGDISIVALVLGVTVTVVVLVITVIILLRLPKAVASVGKKTTTTVAHVVIPTISHHKKLTPKKEKLLTAQLVRIIKFVAALLPMGLLAFIYAVDTELSTNVVLLVGAVLAMVSFVWFSLEYAMAHAFGIQLEDIF